MRLLTRVVAKIGQPLVLMGLRTSSMAAKFALILFITKFIGLTEVGQYGLMLAMAQILPAALGGGLMQRVARDLVGESPQHITRTVGQLWGWGWCLYGLVALGVLALGGFAMVQQYIEGGLLAAALLVLLIARLEQQGQEAFILLNNQDMPLQANLLQFMQAGGWIFVYMASAMLWPHLRTMEMLALFWGVGLGLGIVYFAVMTRAWPWQAAWQRLQWPWLKKNWWQSRWLWLHAVTDGLATHADRFIITALLGLHWAGVYLFFWQAANAVRVLMHTSIYLPRLPSLVRHVKAQDWAKHREATLNLSCTIAGLAAGFFVLLGAVLPLLIPYLNQPLLQTHLWLGVAVFGAVYVRIVMDTLAYGLFSASRDQAFVGSTVVGMGLAWGLNLLFIPLWGVYGAALSFLLGACAMGLWRGLALWRFWQTQELN